MQIVFVRHGESEANVERVISNRNLQHNLTEQGLRQAHNLADKLRSKNIVAIYTSPIRRAHQTAQIMAEKWQVPVYLAEALREFDCGGMEGRGDEEAWHAHRTVMRAWDDEQAYEQRIAGGESFNDLRKRFVPFVAALVEAFAVGEGRIVLVSHGGLLQQMLPVVLSNIDRPFTQGHPLGNCACVVTVPQQEHLICVEWAGLHL